MRVAHFYVAHCEIVSSLTRERHKVSIKIRAQTLKDSKEYPLFSTNNYILGVYSRFGELFIIKDPLFALSTKNQRGETPFTRANFAIFGLFRLNNFAFCS